MTNNNDDIISRRTWMKRVAAGLTGAAAGAATVACQRQATHDNSLSAADATIPCDSCRKCMPCAYGVDIPAILSFYNHATAEGLIPADGDMTKLTRERRHRLLRDYDREIDHRHAALRCISCFHCVPECDRKIIIPRELDRITRMTDTLRDLECYDE